VQESKEVTYRLALAEGFIREANEDMALKRWRSCVDNAQLAIENSGKAVLAMFGVAAKTHDPAQQLAAIVRSQNLPPDVQEAIQQLLPVLLALGAAEHFLTDYGDERTYTLPWDLFTQESATEALSAAQQSHQLANETIKAILDWRENQE
jgi:HEPN domain-containing protein